MYGSSLGRTQLVELPYDIMTKEKAIREEYTNIINYVADRSKLSYTKASTILTKYARYLQNALQRGEVIELEGLFTISFTTRLGKIIHPPVYDYRKQVEELAQEGGFNQLEAESCVSLYLYRIRELVRLGFHVNVKGIGYIKPVRNTETGEIELVYRISPVLKKPEMATFMIEKKNEDARPIDVSGELIRFKMVLNENSVQVSKEIRSTDNAKLSLEYIDI